MNYRDTLEAIELKGDLVAGRAPAVRFMIEACGKMSLPHDAKESLDVAGRYLRNEVSDDALTAARVRCWRSIQGRDADLSDTRVAATRAVICTLYPRGKDDDLFETLNVFEDFALAAGLAANDLLEGIRRAFG